VQLSSQAAFFPPRTLVPTIPFILKTDANVWSAPADDGFTGFSGMVFTSSAARTLLGQTLHVLRLHRR
jgi:hypothetical protein